MQSFAAICISSKREAHESDVCGRRYSQGGAWALQRISWTSDDKPHISRISHRCFCELPGLSSINDADQSLARGWGGATMSSYGGCKGKGTRERLCTQKCVKTFTFLMSADFLSVYFWWKFICRLNCNISKTSFVQMY